MNWKIQRLINKGYVQLEEEKYSDAIACFERAVALSPETSELYAYLGEAYFLNHQYDKAVESFASRDAMVLQSDPLTPYIEGYRGAIYLNQHDYTKAADFLFKAVGKDIKDPEIHYQLAILYMCQKKMAMARSVFKQIEQLDPSFNYKRLKKLVEEVEILVRQKPKSTESTLIASQGGT